MSLARMRRVVRRPHIVPVILLLVIALAGCAPALAASPGELATEKKSKTEIIKVDVVDNPHLFVFDEAPVFEDGMPGHGNTFITQGYIYPHGTLNGSNGVLPDGSPEFPDQVIGTWICRGWFVGDGAHATEGAMAITTQTFHFGEEYGNATLVTEGYETAEVNQPFARPITGGTGVYAQARGEAMQELLGFNEDMAVNLRFEINVSR